MQTIHIPNKINVEAARAALIAAGGSIESGYIDVPTPEAVLAGLDYLAAIHRQRQEEVKQADANRVISKFLDSTLGLH